MESNRPAFPISQRLTPLLSPPALWGVGNKPNAKATARQTLYTPPMTADQFAQAQQDIKTLDERPSNATLLKLYALYKQGSAGDVSGARPGGFDFAGGAKYDAWAALKGQTPEQAQAGYVALVAQLLSE